jgi:hypothetical protein
MMITVAEFLRNKMANKVNILKYAMELRIQLCVEDDSFMYKNNTWVAIMNIFNFFSAIADFTHSFLD